MRIRDIAVGELGASDLARWSELVGRSVEPNLFADPRYLASTAQMEPRAAQQRLLLVEDSDELVGLMPFAIDDVTLGRWRVSTLSVRSPGAFFAGSSRHHPLVARSHLDEAWDALFAGMLGMRRAKVFELYRAPDGALTDAALAAARRRRLPVYLRDHEEVAYTDNRLAAAELDEAIAVSHLSAQTRKARRKDLRGLQAELGGPIELVDEGNDPEALERFMILQAAGWKGDSSSGGRAFLSRGQDEWIRMIAARFRADGDFSILTVRVDDHVVHMQLVLRSGGAAYGFADAYDETLARFGGGGIGRLAGVRWSLADSGAEYLDTCMDPASPQIAGLYPHRWGIDTYAIGLRGVGRQTVRALPTLRRARELASTARARWSSR